MSQVFTAHERKEWPVLALLEGDLKPAEEIIALDFSMPCNRMTPQGEGMVTSGMWPHMTDLVLHGLLLRYNLSNSWTPAVATFDSVLSALRTVMNGKLIDPFLAEAVRENAESAAQILNENLVPKGFSLEVGSTIHDLDLVEDEVIEYVAPAPRPAPVEPVKPEKLKAERQDLFVALSDGSATPQTYLPTLAETIKLAWSYGLHRFGRMLNADVSTIKRLIMGEQTDYTQREIGALYEAFSVAYDYLNQHAVPEGFQLRYEVGYLDLVPSPMPYPSFGVLLDRDDYVSEEELALAVIEWARLHGIRVGGVWRKRLWRLEHQKQTEWKKFPVEAIISEGNRVLDLLNSVYRKSKSHVFELNEDGSFELSKRWPRVIQEDS